jgi:hypothetical protein
MGVLGFELCFLVPACCRQRGSSERTGCTSVSRGRDEVQDCANSERSK